MTPEQIISAVCKASWIKDDEIKSNPKKIHFCDARGIASYLLYTECNMSNTEIGKYVSRTNKPCYMIVERHYHRISKDDYKKNHERVLMIINLKRLQYIAVLVQAKTRIT